MKLRIRLALATLLASSAAAAATPTLKLSWLPVTTMSDGTLIPQGLVVTYNVYGGKNLTGPFSLVETVSMTNTTRNNVDIGQACYRVTAVVNTVESVPTSVICVTVTQIASTVPGTPLDLIVTQTQ